MIYRKSLLSLFTFLLVSVSFSLPHNRPTTQHPFFFTENKGQWDSRVLYKCNARNGMTWFLERDGISLLTMKEDRTKAPIVDPSERDLPEMMRRHPVRYTMKSHALKFKFEGTGNREQATGRGGSPCPPAGVSPYAPTVEATGELGWHNNYFLGNDSTKWAPNCRNYTNIVYRDVWDGIDIEWYEENGKLEFDFVVQPGADPSQIRMSCEGLTGEMSLDGFGIQDSGFGKKEINKVATSLPAHTVAPSDPRNDKSNTGKELKLPTSLGELRTALPQVYQISPGGSRSEVDAKFEITNKNEFGITLPNGYQKEHTLRIDPLIYSTFLGGQAIDASYGIVNDGNGGFIVAGYTTSSDFPTTPGAEQNLNQGSADCIVTHLDNNGSQLIYSTYLGGSNADYVYGIANDGSGGVLLTGGTASFNFPITANACQLTYGGGIYDGFISHLNNDGSQLLSSTYLGGSSEDEAFAVTKDNDNNVIVTGRTASTNFPTTESAFDISYNGGLFDSFIAYVNSAGTQQIYSTYLGGSGDDEGVAIISDGSNGSIIAGKTTSSNFPTTISAYDTSYNGSGSLNYGDCFVTHINSSGTQLDYSTFLGGSSDDELGAIVSDNQGGIFVGGGTFSFNFPTTIGVFDSSHNGTIGNEDCFISHLNSDGSQLIFSTYFGGSNHENIHGMAFTDNGYIAATGMTSSIDYPISLNTFDSTFNGGTSEWGGDCFITYLNNMGSHLMYSSYLGGSGADYGYGIVNNGNDVIVTGRTSSTNFPTTQNAYDTTWGGTTSDCFVAKFSYDTTDVINIKSEYVLTQYSLKQNYPNPFNSSTTISYSLPKSGAVKLELFDLLGRRISTLINSPQNAGVHLVRFDGKNLASGEYFYRLSAGEFQETRKLLLLK